ncbi:MAG TPA: sigma 54-interacting transcriptional regulator [Pyrinomonadaceae bacterium]|nr:sigma 54-interacting transcriptional regulator [Pyrinomonadaceae bacterium]
MNTILPGDGSAPEKPSKAAGVVNLSDARQRVRQRVDAAHAALAAEIEATLELIDRGQTAAAETRLTQIIKATRDDEELLARARCMLSVSLETQERYNDSLAAVQMYEEPQSRAGLAPETSVFLRVQLGIAYNYTGDHPKAIALLNATLREATETASSAQLGAIYIALSRVYRHINEYPIARDNSQLALSHFRNTGDWRGMAEAYRGLGLECIFEGAYEQSLEYYEQALKLVGDRPAPFMLGKTYANMAGACWFLKRPHDGIRYLEKAIDYYERTEHKANAVLGYNNLGINLMLVGDWVRAETALERALAYATEFDEQGAKSRVFPMVLDSLGELQMLRGNLFKAREHLQRAVRLSQDYGSKWYECQALRTLARCHLAMEESARALDESTQALSLAERIGDRQAVCDSRLLLAEVYLRCDDPRECASELQKVTEQTSDSAADMAVAGEAQRIHGLLALAQSDSTLAIHHFGRSVSIYSILGDRYRTALALYGLGRAYESVQPERSAEHFSRALQTFSELGAQLDIARTQDALDSIEVNTTEQRHETSAFAQLLTLRLAEAVASRELLLRELAAVLDQETKARRVLLTELDEEGNVKVVVSHGGESEADAELANSLCMAKNDAEREKFALEHDSTVIMLRPTNATPAVLYIEPRSAASLSGGLPIDSLLRVVELGMNVCALRARVSSGRGVQEQNTYTGTGLMPGFIHSSPAMTRLVEEVHKIRSSDVTVLVTGESGTGKELVARAIHALSSRRTKVFVPFNCTAVPKELSDAYLFGYRRGAFTGAVSDSPGVIRSAAGGTLFLDEIGDLPLEVQPKLLRFLQEGEIQPLGEQRPAKVDVRIIAATNSDLEKMVAEGRFREDLYYRLNVIRLRVPPLCERRSEIPTIVNYYINHYSAKFNRRDIQITPQTIDLLMVCDWPGNVRQLCNEIQRIVARAEDGTLITPDHLSPELKRISAPISLPAEVSPFGANPITLSGPHTTLADAMAELERRMIADALRRHKGNISRAARELGLTRRGLYLKLQRYSLSAASA